VEPTTGLPGPDRGAESSKSGDVVRPPESEQLCYFDGFDFDGALVVATGTTAWMLLTNGSD